MSPRVPRRLANALGALLLALGSVLLTLLVVEGAFRWLDLRGHYEPRRQPGKQEAILTDPARRVPGVRLLFEPHAEFSHVYDSNPRGYFDDDNAIHYRLNVHGFRGPGWEWQKPPGTRRIVFLGDSFTFGAGVRFEDTFVSRVARILNASGTAPVEVLGLAVGGWGTLDEIAYLEHTSKRLDPDLVVVVYVLNDADYSGGLDLWEGFRKRYESRRFESSYLVSYLSSRLARRELARVYVGDLVNSQAVHRNRWEKSFDELLRGRDMVESAGGRYAVVIFPFLYDLDESHPFLPLHERISSFCEENRIDVFDLFPAFAGRAHEDLWVHPSDQHPNEEGHSIAARAIADFIVQRKLLRQPSGESSGP